MQGGLCRGCEKHFIVCIDKTCSHFFQDCKKMPWQQIWVHSMTNFFLFMFFRNTNVLSAQVGSLSKTHFHFFQCVTPPSLQGTTYQASVATNGRTSTRAWCLYLFCLYVHYQSQRAHVWTLYSLQSCRVSRAPGWIQRLSSHTCSAHRLHFFL
jgi:hypothetical protein